MAAARPGRSRLGIAIVLLFGYWLGRFAEFLPAGGLDALDLVVAAVSAVLLMVWYRRRARRYLEARDAAMRARARRVRSEDDAPTDEAGGTR